jgi:hypothetical protein
VNFDLPNIMHCFTSLFINQQLMHIVCKLVIFKGGYTLVTLPRIVTPYRDGVEWTRDCVTSQKLVTRQRYGPVPCAITR